jgi:adenosylcobinamide-GDP ribazoletransferase
MAYFPIIGLFLGGILAAANNLLIFLSFNELISSVMLVVLLIVLTAGLHLDGLADTFDALLSGKPKDEMLKIMRDSRIGVMGVLGLICILLLKISLIYSISAPLKAAALILMCVVSRWSMVFSIFLFPYARQEGKAKIFMQGMNIKIFVLSAISAVTFIFAVWGVKSLLLFLLAALCSYLTAKSISNKIGGITGDSIGAINELTEIIVLFVICIMERAGIWII